MRRPVPRSVPILICLLLFLASIPAEDPPLAEPLSFRLENGSGQWAWRDGETSELGGGVQVWYEGVHIHCDRLSVSQAPVPGLKQSTLDRLDLLPGPAGPAGDRVLLDSTASRSPVIGFRGILAPGSLHLERRPVDPRHPATVHWRAVLADTRYFAGLLQTSSGWVPYAGWSADVEMELAADVVDGRLENPRFTTIHLFGKTDPDASKRHRARLDRLRKPLDKPEDLEGLPLNAAEFGMQSDSISLYFDDQGLFDRAGWGSNATQYGVPPSDSPLRVRSRLEPGK
jgi:hypothetical protein